jgi:perosamine synthetase
MNFNFTPRFYYTLNLISYLSPFTNTPKIHTKEFLFGKDVSVYNFTNARTGLRVLLNSISTIPLKIGIQAYTCHTVFQAIKKAGHIPVFIDLTNDFKLDLEDIKKKVNEIDVLIVTHTFGFPDDLNEIKKIVGDKIIIEDCAHSFLSKYKGLYTGTLGDAAIFSSGLAKFPAVGSGGFCVVNDSSKFHFIKSEYEKIFKPKLSSSIKDYIKTLVFSIMMRPLLYGLITYKLGKALDKKIDFGDKFSFKEFKGYSWSKKIFDTGYPLFNKILFKQTENADLLSSLLKRNNSINHSINNDPNHYAYPILLSKRELLYVKLLNNNIETGRHFHKSIEWAT